MGGVGWGGSGSRRCRCRPLSTPSPSVRLSSSPHQTWSLPGSQTRARPPLPFPSPASHRTPGRTCCFCSGASPPPRPALPPPPRPGAHCGPPDWRGLVAAVQPVLGRHDVHAPEPPVVAVGGAGVLLHLERVELDVVDGGQHDAPAVLPDPREGGLGPGVGCISGGGAPPLRSPQQGAPLQELQGRQAQTHSLGVPPAWGSRGSRSREGHTCDLPQGRPSPELLRWWQTGAQAPSGAATGWTAGGRGAGLCSGRAAWPGPCLLCLRPASTALRLQEQD